MTTILADAVSRPNSCDTVLVTVNVNIPNFIGTVEFQLYESNFCRIIPSGFTTFNYVGQPFVLYQIIRLFRCNNSLTYQINLRNTFGQIVATQCVPVRASGNCC